MKLPILLCLLFALPLPAAASTTNKADKTEATLKPATGKPAQKATTAVLNGGGVKASAEEIPPAPAQAPTPVPPPTGKATLETYLAALADEMTLSKDEKTDIQTYYLDDGAKLNGILNNDSLSPLEQTRQVDALRDARDAKIRALLGDVTRQEAFAKVEAEYRVALVELAAKGGLVPKTPPPRVPEPTAATAAQADKASKSTTP